MDYTFKILRALSGYQFFLCLLIQGFFLHPFYEKSLSAKLIRLGFMPITIWLALSSNGIRQFEPIEDFFHMNFPLISFATFHAICLSIEFGLSNASVLDSTKTVLNDKTEDQNDDGCEVKSPDGSMDDQLNGGKESLCKRNASSKIPSMGERIKFLIWLIFSPRGLQTSWSPPTSMVPRSNQISMKEFVKRTLKKSILNQFLFLIIWMISISFAQHPFGVYGVLQEWFHLPNSLILKTLAPYLVVGPFASSAMLLIELLGCMFNLIEVSVYYLGPKFLPSDLAPGKWDSTLYPPLFNQPWKSSSLIEFWSKPDYLLSYHRSYSGWHTIFRRHIVFCGADPSAWMFKPFGKEASRLASTLGAMLFSGLFHEFVVVAASKIDPTFSTTWVFLGSGIGMILEIIFKKLTGRQVGGIFGKIWLWCLLSFLGTPAMENW
ncbi:uncharacterized protein MELLADRAFT_108970 [Melampsora larici-populina 98AG31]|uniref:Wax synthase domain-containing protein n=1 Tax=Melampsora larici-populina (strain 98AG31 / pathotype 3-4-7) TaxID=747676 RepID=F4RUX0_MELLP|nr:uncharacterized protein MELLADRAFT_108970 [Melampsora larici-populina 98AG31]EGG03769.1 hypothetical protein MELLADRAFT_108970 [Melampsora larici-populina 98AG31]